MSVASVVNNNVSPTTLCIRNQFPDETVQVQSTASLISSTCGFHRADTRSPIIQRSNDMMVDFFRLYERHCDDILYLILMEQFDMVKPSLFWHRHYRSNVFYPMLRIYKLIVNYHLSEYIFVNPVSIDRRMHGMLSPENIT